MNQHPQSLKLWEDLRNSDCTACDLHRSAQCVCLLGDGPVPCDAMIVGEGPGFREDNVKIPFSGKSGLFLRKMLKKVGLDPRKIFITNVVACRPEGNRTPTRKEAKTCSELYLDRQFDLVKPKVVLLLGNIAVAWAKGKKAAVTALEGTTFPIKFHTFLDPNKHSTATCVPSRHPASVIRAEGEDGFKYLAQKFKENLLLFKRCLNPVKDEFKFIQKFPILKKNLPAYVDIETNGLNPFLSESKIHCMSIQQSDEEVYAFKMDPPKFEALAMMLSHVPIIVQRGTFEGTWFRHHLGITPKLYHDTKVGSFVIDENEQSGLKYQAIKCLGVEPWSEEQDWKNPDFTKMLPYNARDTVYGLRLYKERDLPFLKKHPKMAKLLRYIILPAEEVFTEIICNGFHINIEEAKKKLLVCKKEKERLNREINKIAGKEMNPGSPKQMNWLFFEKLKLKCPVKTKKGNFSTAEASLVRLKGQHPVVQTLWDWRGWEKNDSTYLTPWMERGPVLHANYGFTDVDTGRLNSTMVKNSRHEKGAGATLHQCPRDRFIRNLVAPRGFVPYTTMKPDPDAWCIVSADESQAELRFVTHASGDITLTRLYEEGKDVHLATAIDILHIEEIDEETRKKAKAVNFGFVYGMFAKKFVAYALEKFDVKFTLTQGEEYRERYFNKYKGLLPWHRRVEAFVTANGYVDSVFGRRRNLPLAMRNGHDEWIQREAVRKAINSPIQSAASDTMLFIAALIASRSLPWTFKIDKQKCFGIGSAHDSLLFECRKDYAKELKQGLIYTMENLPVKKYFNFEFRVPMVLEVDVYSDCWKGKKMEV